MRRERECEMNGRERAGEKGARVERQTRLREGRERRRERERERKREREREK